MAKRQTSMDPTTSSLTASAATTSVRLSRKPSLLRRVELDDVVTVTPIIVPAEGEVIAVEVLSTLNRWAMIEDTTGHISDLVEGDIVAAVLAKRRSFQVFNCDIPSRLSPGDTLSYVSKSGIVGVVEASLNDTEIPVQVRVLGSILKAGAPVNIKHSAIPRCQTLSESAPIVVVAGTASNTGKTTTARNIIQHLKSRGLRVAGAKLSGVALWGELRCLAATGADLVLGFADGGLPTTCGNPTEVVEVSLGILRELNKINPDVIVVEFGSCLLGFYNIMTVLDSPQFRQHVASLVLTASDTVAAWGLKRLMEEHKIDITLVTGPVVNNITYVGYIERELDLSAESNTGPMPKTFQLIDARLNEIGSETAKTEMAFL
ncbi:hypothetical protein BDV37DRAFT_200676 [Aspergillus pseudonomiae]|uniref:P-loop containing nucleoside triphosphate hydrolase protein n=1 Tax=Aspergillus pseudonomiae TaxID=1506151 RepID=A0A5N7D3C2_9EURO|nr:uncharacterized protein BDV37DRAFT_200676 [Aspergillus pseudonomiae]KAE8400617.1 hypothetical protein BDV37DRAFT_200676 [Aspergillus pseudonomiae]